MNQLATGTGVRSSRTTKTSHSFRPSASGPLRDIAVAVAVAAAIAAGDDVPYGPQFLAQVLEYVPHGETHDRIQMAVQIPPTACRYIGGSKFW